METMLIDRLEAMLSVYKSMAERARDEQKTFEIDSENRGYTKVDMEHHAEWASAVMKEAMTMYVVSDIEKILKEFFDKQQRWLEDYRIKEWK